MTWDPTWMPRFPHTVASTAEESAEFLHRVGWHKTAERFAARGLSTTTELAPVAEETVLAAGLEEGAAAGLTVGTAGGFEIPVWGWIATGVAVAGGVGYGVYKHYQHKQEAESTAQKTGFKNAPQAAQTWGDKASAERVAIEPVEKAGSNERRHFNKAQLIETQHIIAGTATVGEVEDVQRALKIEGLDIGKYGKKHDGVDGIAGPFTRKAIAAAMKRLGPEPLSSL